MNKKLLRLLLLLLLIIPLNVYANTVINGNNFAIYNRTKEQIYNKWSTGKIDRNVTIYTTEPNYYSPYRAGVVTNEYLDEVLDNLNYYRYLVGVPEITENTSNDEALQKAEVIQTLYVEENWSLTHHLYEDFEKPDDMSDDFWGSEEECKNEGICYGAYANHNIISYGRTDEPNFYFFDESIFDEDYPEAGHRMALLSPEVAKEDYGIGEEVIYGRSTQSRSNYNKMTNSFAAYPSPGYFPKEDFADTSDWDIFLNIDNFRFLTAAQQNNVVVTITNLTTNVAETRTLADGNLYFDYECDGTYCTIYNRMNILQPTRNTEYYEDNYTVYVENLIDKNGNLVDLTYTVEFYNKLEGTTSHITNVNQELKGVYFDGPYDSETVASIFEDLSYGLELDNGDVYEYIPTSHQINYYGAPSSGIVEYHAYPGTSELPSYIVDTSSILANKYINIYGNTTNETYKYRYGNVAYNADVGGNVTLRVNDLVTDYEGYFLGGWVRKKNNKIEAVDTEEDKYSLDDDNILALNINNITAQDAGEYYQVTLQLVPNEESSFDVYFYLSKPITLTVTGQAESITFDSENMTIRTGDTEKLNVTITPSTASPNLTWQSSDSTIVSVDNEGNITGLKAGTSTITVTDGNVSGTITITVTNYLKGDLNKNNQIDLADIIYLLKRYLNVEETTSEDITIGDMNEDGNIGLTDIILLLRIYLGVN